MLDIEQLTQSDSNAIRKIGLLFFAEGIDNGLSREHIEKIIEYLFDLDDEVFGEVDGLIEENEHLRDEKTSLEAVLDQVEMDKDSAYDEGKGEGYDIRQEQIEGRVDQYTPQFYKYHKEVIEDLVNYKLGEYDD